MRFCIILKKGKLRCKKCDTGFYKQKRLDEHLKNVHFLSPTDLENEVDNSSTDDSGIADIKIGSVHSGMFS